MKPSARHRLKWIWDKHKSARIALFAGLDWENVDCLKCAWHGCEWQSAHFIIFLPLKTLDHMNALGSIVCYVPSSLIFSLLRFYVYTFCADLPPVLSLIRFFFFSVTSAFFIVYASLINIPYVCFPLILPVIIFIFI